MSAYRTATWATRPLNAHSKESSLTERQTHQNLVTKRESQASHSPHTGLQQCLCTVPSRDHPRSRRRYRLPSVRTALRTGVAELSSMPLTTKISPASATWPAPRSLLEIAIHRLVGDKISHHGFDSIPLCSAEAFVRPHLLRQRWSPAGYPSLPSDCLACEGFGPDAG